MEARFWRNFDLILLTTTVVLLIFGVAMVQSATLRTGTSWPSLDSLAMRQAIFAVVGIGAMFLLARIDYRFLETFTVPLYIFIIVLLGVVFAIGHTSFGAQRWIDTGLVTLQPSELAKLIVILVLAKFFSDHEGKMGNPLNILLAIVYTAIPLGLIYLQPDLGTSLVVVAIWLGMIIVIGTPIIYFIIGIAVSVPTTILAWQFLLQDYMRQRFLIFLNPESDPLGQGYNILQARISIGAGGWFGQGYGSGIQSQLHYLRVTQSDFIFSVVGEEFGFFGALAIMPSSLSRGVAHPTCVQHCRGYLWQDDSRRSSIDASLSSLHQRRHEFGHYAGDRHPSAIHQRRWELSGDYPCLPGDSAEHSHEAFEEPILSRIAPANLAAIRMPLVYWQIVLQNRRSAADGQSHPFL
ncbi:MAG: rod shape-determining protein RodA [Chloroflexi bacterium]|nr:rod shape-determining protein RodA [Chloroflexota bacterium]